MIDSNFVIQGAIVRIRCELASGEFTAIAQVTSRHDRRGCVENRHPTFRLLEKVGKYPIGMEFWGTTSDVLEMIDMPTKS
jgi:hypothetical protein